LRYGISGVSGPTDTSLASYSGSPSQTGRTMQSQSASDALWMAPSVSTALMTSKIREAAL
jgi:hypothetical protein